MPPRPARSLFPKFLLAAAALSWAVAAQAAPSAQFVLDGQVSHGGTYTLPTLQALPALTQTVSFKSGSSTQAHTYTGASLWGVLDGAGIVTSGAKNDVLNKLVLATGSDGYKAVYSLGELHPAFGHEQSLLAYAETVAGTPGPLGADGYARTTAPTDVKGGRYVSNLSRLTVLPSGSRATGTGGGTSAQFAVSGDVLHGGSFDLAALQALPQTTVTVGADRYSGVSLWSLLATTTGLATDSAVKNDVLGMYVVATGSDGYQAVFSLGELSPDFGGQPDLIALARNGSALGDSGFARLVVPNDTKAGRWVSNLVSLEVYHALSPVPEPSSAALMAAGVVLLAGWRFRPARRAR